MAFLERYQKTGIIARGNYSVVYDYLDLNNNERVAIKKISKQLYGNFNRTREMDVLPLNHNNLVRLREVQETEIHWYLIFDYVDSNLNNFMAANPNLNNDHQIRVFLLGILRGLAHCHAHEVIHRNLEPQNILLNTLNNSIRIGGFGQSREFSNGAYTPKVGTLNYMSPEILMDSSTYSNSTDIWSAGCIFAEMSLSRQLFRGNNVKEQLTTIFSIVGSPTDETWPGFKWMPAFEPSFYSCQAQNLNDIFSNLGVDGSDLISNMLLLDPDQRISAQNALEHPYFVNHGFGPQQ